MIPRRPSAFGLAVTFLFLGFAAAPGQTLIITNGVQTLGALTNTTVTMSNRCELRLTASSSPMPSCLVNLNSADAFLVLQNIRPSVVVASYLSQVRVNGATALCSSAWLSPEAVGISSCRRWQPRTARGYRDGGRFHPPGPLERGTSKD